MTDFHKTWYVGRGNKYHPCGLSFEYLSWLANNKIEGKYPEFCTGYSDETWYVGSDGQRYYPRGLSSPNVHI